MRDLKEKEDGYTSKEKRTKHSTRFYAAVKYHKNLVEK